MNHLSHFSRFQGWGAFRLLWAVQALSRLGTGMTRFAVMIWAYDQAGSATALALLGFFSCLTYVIASPFAGVLVDRWDRKRVLFLADLGAGLMTVMLLALHLTGQLHLWHLYLAVGMAGAFEAFQEPAFWASVSLILPRQDYTRGNGLLGLGQSAARMFAPIAAGLLLPAFGLAAVLLTDLATLCLALAALFLVLIPKPERSLEGRRAGGDFWRELRFGTGYILRQPGLRSMLVIFFLINLFATITYFGVHAPMILARTGGDEWALGIVRTAMGLGGIGGGLVISLWRNPRHKARLFLISTALSFLVCDFLTAISRGVAGWAAAGFISELTIPFIVSPYYAIWQERVPGDVQGRVFATREMVQIASQPVGYLLGGLLADRVFEPGMLGGGWLAQAASLLVGSGPGAGMAAMFLCTSLFGCLTGVLGLLSPAIRKLDEVVEPAPAPGSLEPAPAD